MSVDDLTAFFSRSETSKKTTRKNPVRRKTLIHFLPTKDTTVPPCGFLLARELTSIQVDKVLSEKEKKLTIIWLHKCAHPLTITWLKQYESTNLAHRDLAILDPSRSPVHSALSVIPQVFDRIST